MHWGTLRHLELMLTVAGMVWAVPRGVLSVTAVLLHLPIRPAAKEALSAPAPANDGEARAGGTGRPVMGDELL